MLEQRMSAWEARRQFGRVLKDVSYKKANVIVESHGEEIAVVIPIDLYRQLRSRRAAFFNQLREVSERVDLSETESTELVDHAMRETGRLPA